ncbi:hypothetical protein GUITHDRAFT_103815 [Guillardia theta CCMP2712]|uniref:Uncharacterized protein n=1 Tax=Guillardia theta (strain CCMP2712) TaxID=905079 RepID=L1JQW9_GUITC|nr:hypothetical protein GUITHDRAFT_103815 [Guillardia theta CCMP2712]EKX50590.1 hypothetical protein GUITHDRAFT_103815 [Guillardia theta CCMP2712]|eukprot:XP_005837570.1 hypothetical protein GUITHDRAFT_103815 [Guillardia theta CCMP2712]
MGMRCIGLRGGADDDSLFDISKEVEEAEAEKIPTLHVEGVEDSVLEQQPPEILQGDIHYGSEHSSDGDPFADTPIRQSRPSHEKHARRPGADPSELDDLSEAEAQDVERLTAELDADIQRTMAEDMKLSDDSDDQVDSRHSKSAHRDNPSKVR